MSREETDARLDRLVELLHSNAQAIGGAPGGGIDVERLAAAIVAAQDAAAKLPGRNVLDEQVEQIQQMRSRPGGRLGYSHHVTSIITRATFTVEVQESRKSKLGRITSLIGYQCPTDWLDIICTQNPQFDKIVDKVNSRDIQQAKYEAWYKPDLRYYVGALIGEHNSGNPNPVRCDEDHWIALPVIWPEDPAYEETLRLVEDDRTSNRVL